VKEDRGAVLLVVLLLALAMLGLGHGLMISAEGVLTTAKLHARITRLEALADGAMEDELDRGWRVWMDSIPIGATSLRTVPEEPAVGVRWRRLAPEVWIAEIMATEGGGASVGGRRLAWILDPASRAQALPGVVSVGRGGTVTGAGSIMADAMPGIAFVDSPALGLLDLDRLLSVADSIGPVGSPGPVERGGRCDTTDRWNWGDPAGPRRPCGSVFALSGSEASVAVDGGAGQGLLVVRGDVVVRAGAEFHGIVLASGRVEVLGTSRIYGRVVAFAGVAVEPGSLIVGDIPAAQRALFGLLPRLGISVALHDAVTLGPD